MGVDVNKMREDAESHQRGGDFIQLENGETLVYIHPPCRDNDTFAPTTGLPYIPVTVHYGVGKSKSMVVSLDKEKNPVIAHPFLKEAFKAKKIRIPEVCPMAEALASGTLTDDEIDDMRPQTRFMFGMTVLGFRKDSKSLWSMEANPKPGVYFGGKQVYDGITGVFFDYGDITDPNAAILVRLIKSGKDRNTKYEGKVHTETAKKAMVLSKGLRAKLADAMKVGGDCDLWRIVGNFLKTPAEVEALLSGAAVSGDAAEFDDDAPAPAKRTAAAKPAPKRAAPAPEPEEVVPDDEAELEAEAAGESEEPAEAEAEQETIEHSQECIEAGGEDCVEDCPVAIYLAEQAAAEAEPEAEEAAAEEEAAEETPEEPAEAEEEVAEETAEVEAEAEAEEEVAEEPEEPPPPPPKKAVASAKPAPKPAPAPAKPAAAKPAPAPAKPAVAAKATPAAKPAAAAAAKPAAKPAAPPADEDLGLEELEAELKGMTAPPKAAAKPAVAAAKPAAAATPAPAPAKPAPVAAKPAAAKPAVPAKPAAKPAIVAKK